METASLVQLNTSFKDYPKNRAFFVVVVILKRRMKQEFQICTHKKSVYFMQ